MPLTDPKALYVRSDIRQLRADLALALRAAALHGLSESVCNHFSVMLPDGLDGFLINPQGLLWQEVHADDIILVDGDGQRLAGPHPVESTAMFIHAAVHRIANKVCVLHTHMPYSTALACTSAGGLDTRLTQNAMRFHGRVCIDRDYNGLALDSTEGARIAHAMHGADVAFLGNHGVVVCGTRVDHAYDDLYFLERACMHEILARSSGLPLMMAPEAICEATARQLAGERLQSELFFQALGRQLPERNPVRTVEATQQAA